LAANALGGDVEAEVAGALGRIREHLKRQDNDALVDTLIGLAERDPALFRQLDMAAATAHADDKTLVARLRKAIDQATRTGGYIHYREAPAWAAEMGVALDSIVQLAAAGRGAPALELAERAIDRIEQVFEEIDDSDGHWGALLHRCRDIHLAAARVASPDPLQLARDLFTREIDGDHDVFDGAVALYADVLGDTGLAEYRRLAAEAWAKLPPRSGRTSQRDVPCGNYHGLANVLDFFAEREGDIDARIALRAKNLSSPWDFLQLAEFCLSQGRPDEALRRAEEGLWLFEDGRQDERLVCFTAGLLSKANRRGEAEALLQRAFEKAPSLELYARLSKFGSHARDRAVELLRARVTTGTPSRWHAPADLLVSVLMQECEFGQAWAAVRSHGASVGVKEALAHASEAVHPREAIEVYAKRVDHLVDGGGNSAYAEAAALIARIAGLRSPVEQEAYVLALKARFGRKRNFMQLLG
jgi:tetratricopeptide (TPR) repeat protein